MVTAGEKIIPLSKTRIVLLLVCAFVFVALGVFMISLDDAKILAQRRFNNPAFVHAMGLAAVVFFGFCGVIAFRKLFDRKPGLVLNDAGFTDNASGIAAGFIPWSDVADVQPYSIQGQQMLVILLVDTDKYVNQGNAARRMLNRTNTRMCGSPVVIAPTALEISYEDLVAAFGSYRHKMGGRV